MFLDAFKLDTLTLQVQYETTYHIWDRAGLVATELCRIWPGLQLLQGQPQQQTFKGKGVQVITGIQVSTVALSAISALDATLTHQMKETFELWRKSLALEQLSRVSCRAVYAREFASLHEANEAIVKLNLVRMPSTKVFDQPQDSDKNSIEVMYRFEDEMSFTFLRLRTEQLKFEVQLDPPFDDKELKKNVNRLIVDFDRGVIGSTKAGDFRMDEWLKGYQHVLRRDLGKVVGSQS